jgi:uncharacterized membrane protein
MAVIAARLPFLVSPVLGGDAAYHARAAMTVLNGGLLYRDVPYTYPPLYAYTEALSIAALGNTNLGWKATAQAYDLGCVVLIYLIVSRQLGPNKGLVSAALYGFSPLSFFATSSFASFDSTAAFWMLASLLLLMYRKTVTSAITLGVGTAYKYFPLLLVPAALAYLQTKRQRLSFAAISIGSFVVIQLPFLLTEFSTWLNEVVLFHVNRPASGASLYNLLTLHPQLFQVVTPLAILSPIPVLLSFILVGLSSDRSDKGLLKNSAFLMLTAAFFSKVVLFYALWYIPLICTFVLALKKRTLGAVAGLFFALQVAQVLGWYVYDSMGSFGGALALAYVYLFTSGALLVWLFHDRIPTVFKQRSQG